jgi:hypothetical protein
MSLPGNWASGNTYTATNQNNVEAAANQSTNSLTKYGIVDLDTFAGSTDDAKLTAALTYAAAQTHIPAIRLAARSHSFSTTGRTPFTGMKLQGSEANNGPKNLELGAANAPTQAIITGGVDGSSWFNGASGTWYDVGIRNIAFQAGNTTTQFWSQPGGTLYACEFNSLTFYGFNHVFGSLANKALVTQVSFTGQWQVIGGTGVQFHLGGSDCSLWFYGYCNMGNGGSANADVFQVIFDTLGKTNVGYLYITCTGGWAGMLLEGGGTGLNFHGGTYEGLNAGSPATAPPVVITGGNYAFFGSAFDFTTTANGVITQSGGTVALYSPSYQPASSSPSPLIYQTGGSAAIYSPLGNPPYRWSDGTTGTLSFNTINAHP